MFTEKKKKNRQPGASNRNDFSATNIYQFHIDDESQQKNANFHDIPTEILLKILAYASYKERKNFH